VIRDATSYFCLLIINNNQIMKPLAFRNSSRALAALLAPTPSPAHDETPSFYDEDLQFSTFRSDDYRFYEHFPAGEGAQTSEESSFGDSSFEVLEQEESESEEEVEFEKKQLSSYGSTNESVIAFRTLSFRNSAKAISSILGPSAGKFKGKYLNFRNSSVLLRGLVSYREKEI
jgi:hypothetical protein